MISVERVNGDPFFCSDVRHGAYLDPGNKYWTPITTRAYLLAAASTIRACSDPVPPADLVRPAMTGEHGISFSSLRHSQTSIYAAQNVLNPRGRLLGCGRSLRFP